MPNLFRYNERATQEHTVTQKLVSEISKQAF